VLKTTLGRTGLQVTRTAFGVLPLQRTEKEEAARILRAAYDAGINFYDTARGYTDSEEKIGYALSDVRDRIIIATKSHAKDRKGLLAHLETSLRELRTDYVDLLQLHNSAVPDANDPDSSYAGLIEAREKGLVRFVGITCHSRDYAFEAVASGLFDTLQYPLCHLSADEDLALVEKCREANIGFIAMKPLSGGLITNIRAAFAFFRQYENVVPIWGIQRMTELEEILALDADPPALDSALSAAIDQDRRELAGDFCRACGYCMPCTVDIPIPMAARMPLLLRRMPYRDFLSPDWQERMRRVENCTDCGACRERCPYGLDTPALLRRSLIEYEQFLRDQS